MVLRVYCKLSNFVKSSQCYTSKPSSPVLSVTIPGSTVFRRTLPSCLKPPALNTPQRLLADSIPASLRTRARSTVILKRGRPGAPAGASAPLPIAYLPLYASRSQGAVAVGDYDSPSDPSTESPEVTISPADNGHVVRWHQRGDGKKTEGRTVKRVASTREEALGHAAEALGGGSGSRKSSKKKSSRDGQTLGADPSDAGDGASVSSPAAQTSPHVSRVPRRSTARRRRPRAGGRRS